MISPTLSLKIDLHGLHHESHNQKRRAVLEITPPQGTLQFNTETSHVAENMGNVVSRGKGRIDDHGVSNEIGEPAKLPRSI